jgi:anti-sigma regulatory factor (Ser/Thr protein kinase)
VSPDASTRVFAAALDELPGIRRYVATEATLLSFANSVPDLQLAVTEACSNAIRHSRTGEIRVSVWLRGPCLEITVEDDGVYREIPPDTRGGDHRGLDVIAAVVDELSLRRGTQETPGTVIRFRKCRP